MSLIREVLGLIVWLVAQFIAFIAGTLFWFAEWISGIPPP